MHWTLLFVDRRDETSTSVMPGLVPGIHDLENFTLFKVVDGRDKLGHDA
jgi:hypothetical protein